MSSAGDRAARSSRYTAETRPSDLGLYEIKLDPADRWKYRTPSLRNVAVTAPYMHDGSLATLRSVVEFYRRGGVANETLDPLVAPLGLTDAQVGDLVVFLESLTSSGIETLVLDARAAPIGDPGQSAAPLAGPRRAPSQNAP